MLITRLTFAISQSFSAHVFFALQQTKRRKINFLSQLLDGRKFSVIFFGTEEFSKVSLEVLNKNRLLGGNERVIDKLDVVSIKDKCPVRQYCEINGLTLHDWPYIVPKDEYDVGIVASFGHLIPTNNIHACKYGMINAHPSLLPRWRGAAPIIYTVLAGDEETGVTILQVSPKRFDVGRILMQERIPVPEICDINQLTAMLSEKSSLMLLDALKNLPHLIDTSWPQPEEGVTHAKKVMPNMGCIDWKKNTVMDIDRKYRAFKGTINLFSFWRDKKILLLDLADPGCMLEAKINTLVADNLPYGYTYFHKRRKIVFVKCKDGWVGILTVSIPMRGQISATDFNNGFIIKVKPEERMFITNIDENK